DQLAVRAGAADEHAVGLELAAVLIIELEAVAMAFVDLAGAIGLVGPAAGDQAARVGAQAHGAAQVGDGVLLVQHADDGVGTIAVHLGAVGVGQADLVAGELDGGALEAEADAEEGNATFAGEADRLDLAGDAAVAEAPGYQNAVHAAEDAFGPLAFDL